MPLRYAHALTHAYRYLQARTYLQSRTDTDTYLHTLIGTCTCLQILTNTYGYCGTPMVDIARNYPQVPTDS